MSKFTPGPWQVRHTDKVSYVFSKTKLADVFSEAFRDTANQEANANLIAAAPEMYVALERVKQMLGGWREAITELEDFCSEPVRLRNMMAAVDQIDDITPKIRAALAKADAK